MCFSPEADLVAGAVISAIGVDCLRHVRHSREIPLASLPLLLGVHQLVECLVWWNARGRLAPGLGHVAMWAYLIFAFCVMPILIPAGVIGIEPTRRKRWLMSPFLAVGAAIAGVLAYDMATGPVSVHEMPFHLAYRADIGSSSLIVSLYVLVTCAPLLLSGYRHVAVFGTVNLVAAAFLAYAINSGFTSIWCAWAAVASAAIAVHLRLAKHHREKVRAILVPGTAG